MLYVEAIDEEGNMFTKLVTLIIDDGRKVIDFGWPVQYAAEGLVIHYPYEKDQCIDMGGRNHRGIPNVCIPKETMNKILETLVPEMLGQTNE